MSQIVANTNDMPDTRKAADQGTERGTIDEVNLQNIDAFAAQEAGESSSFGQCLDTAELVDPEPHNGTICRLHAPADLVLAVEQTQVRLDDSAVQMVDQGQELGLGARDT